MSTPTDKDLLTRELRERAGRLGGHPIGLDDVRARARSLQRRRRVAGGLVAAAVLAVALPVGLLAGDRLTGTQVDPANPTPAPSPVPTPSPAPVPDGPQRLSTEDLPRGPEPGVPYLLDGALVTPDGTADLGVGPLLDAGRFAAGWYAVVAADSEGGRSLVLLDADRREVQRTALSGGVALSGSRDVLAYATPDGRVLAVDERATPVELGRAGGGPLSVVALAGSGDCLVAGDCQAFVDVDGPEPRAVQLPDGARVGTGSASYLSLADAAPDAGVLTGLVSVDDLEPGSCSVLLDRAAGRQWRTCDFRLGRLSPDAAHVAASSAYADGLGDAELAVLDAATGDVRWHLLRRTQGDLLFADWAWEDDEHLLVVAYQQGAWSLLRVGLDGSAELAAEQVRGSEMDRPFALGERP